MATDKTWKVRDLGPTAFFLLGIMADLLGNGVNAPDTDTLSIEAGNLSAPTLRKALKTLTYYGLVVSPGTTGQGGRQTWMLAGLAPTLEKFFHTLPQNQNQI